MSFKTSLVMTAVAAFTTVGLIQADEWDKKTIVTIDAPVMVPHHVVLQPGTYVIKLDRSDSNRHIVRFYDSKGKKQITAAMAINNARLEPNRDGKSTFIFYEAAAGQPRAIRGWFYPGDTWGQEFIYSKKDAALIASYNKSVKIEQDEEANLVVPPPPAEVIDDKAVVAEETKVAEVTPAPEPAPLPEPAPVAVVETAPQQDNVVIAQNTPPPPPVVTPAPAPVPVETPAELPKTASNLPAIGAFGLISLLAAAGTSRLRSKA